MQTWQICRPELLASDVDFDSTEAEAMFYNCTWYDADLHFPTQLNLMFFHQQPITQIVIAPNLEVLATSSLDGFVKVWNICFDEEEDPRYLDFFHPLIFFIS